MLKQNSKIFKIKLKARLAIKLMSCNH